MTIDELKDNYAEIFSLIECPDENTYPKILTDNIPVETLNKVISIFVEDGYGHYSNVKIGDFICDKNDEFHDISGIDLFYHIEEIFTWIFVYPETHNSSVKFTFANDEMNGFIENNLKMFINRCDGLAYYIKSANYDGQIVNPLTDEEITNFGESIKKIKETIISYFTDDAFKFLPKTDEETMTPQEYYEAFRGKFVSYKGKMNGKVAGYVEHYLIIGFDDERGCIKSFSPQVVYDKNYKSYRFSKMKNIIPF